MPIIVALLALIALIYGAVRAFDALRAAFGLGVAVGVAVVAGLLVVAAAAYGWRRRQQVAPNVRGDGDWTHALKGDWGELKLAAGKRFCELHVGGEKGAYIFADLLDADVRTHDGAAQLAVKVNDPRHAEWHVPMADRSQAKQWRRIFLLAREQRL